MRKQEHNGKLTMKSKGAVNEEIFFVHIPESYIFPAGETSCLNFVFIAVVNPHLNDQLQAIAAVWVLVP